MREIKLKAWDDEQKKWISMIEAHYNDETKVTTVTPPAHVHVVEYTGMKDKHNVEIYEGEIFAGDPGTEYECEMWEVAWEEDRDLAGWNVTPGIAEEGQVIGNRFENPELLEGT